MERAGMVPATLGAEQMTFNEACKVAAERSKDGCSVHVNASIQPIPERLRNDLGEFMAQHVIPYDGYSVSDWMDGTTVATFTYGEER
jgi:hypothetical protein